METRQEALDKNAAHLAQVRKDHPEVDTKEMATLMEENIHFRFDVKETLGNDTWERMNDALSKRLNDFADAQAGLAIARQYLDGHEDLQRRFDVIFQKVNSGTVAFTRDMMAEANK